MATSNYVRGKLVIDNLPDIACYQTFEELLRGLPDFLVPQLPNNVTNVVISSTEPLDTERGYLWIKRANSGSFQGFFLFSGSSWKQIWPVPSGIFRMYGDSRSIPEGYLLADENNPALTASQGNFLKTQWLADSSGTYYTIFDVTYIGF